MVQSIKSSQSDEASGFSITFERSLAFIVYIILSPLICNWLLQFKFMEKKILSEKNCFKWIFNKSYENCIRQWKSKLIYYVDAHSFCSFLFSLTHSVARYPSAFTHTDLRPYVFLLFIHSTSLPFFAITSINNLVARSFAVLLHICFSPSALLVPDKMIKMVSSILNCYLKYELQSTHIE